MTRARIFLLEGPDGAGKSTYADYLAQREFARTGRPARIVHNGPPALDTGHQLYTLYRHQLERAEGFRTLDISTIIDRSWPSEAVYGPLFRGGSLLSPRRIRYLERFATNLDVTRILITTPPQVRFARVNARSDETADLFEVVRIGIHYERYLQRHKGWTTIAGS